MTAQAYMRLLVLAVVALLAQHDWTQLFQQQQSLKQKLSRQVLMEVLNLLGMWDLTAFPTHTLRQTQAVYLPFHLVQLNSTSPQTIHYTGAC